MTDIAQHEHFFSTYSHGRFTYKIHKNSVVVVLLSSKYLQQLELKSVRVAEIDLSYVVGKAKNQAYYMRAADVLVWLNDEPVHSPLLLKIVEVNQELTVAQLQGDCERDGYVAVFLPKRDVCQRLQQVLRKLEADEALNDEERDFKAKFMNV